MLSRASHAADTEYVRVALPAGTLRRVHWHVPYCAVGLLGTESGLDGVDHVLFGDTDAAFALVDAVQQLAAYAARHGTLAPTVLAVDLVRLVHPLSSLPPGVRRVLPRGWSRTDFVTLARLAGEQAARPPPASVSCRR